MYIETTLENWKDIFKIEHSFLSNFVFRGQKESGWNLRTSIERTPPISSTLRVINGVNTEERWMIDHFKRKQHMYSDDFRMVEDCKFSILSKIQHYGGKTRLLDFSHSIFIAIYFAVEDSFLFNNEISEEMRKSIMERQDHYNCSSLWCVNMYKIRGMNNEKLNLYVQGKALKDDCRRAFIKSANQFIAKEYSKDDRETISTVLPMEVEYFSERISRQQGMFLMPTNSEKSFMENLWYSFNPANKADNKFNENPFGKKTFDDFLKVSKDDKENIDVVKINIRNSLNQYVIESLIQMNITPEILFPGLTGLAKSVYEINSDN
jgi:hypothetical protein